MFQQSRENQSKISVLQVGKFFFPEQGGIETTTKLIAEELQQTHQTDVLCFSKGKKGSTKMFGSSIIYECGHWGIMASTPISFSFFYKFFTLRNKYDVIHVHVPNPLAVLAILIFRCRSKVVVHWHSDILNQKNLYKVFRYFETIFLRKADMIFATSPTYVEHSIPLQSQIKKVVLLPSTIDTKNLPVNDELVQQIKSRYSDKAIVFSLGRFVYYKGFEYLIQAATYLDDRFVIIIGGKGPLKSFYSDLITKYGLEKKVVIAESIPYNELGSYYKACDIFCLPSCEKTEAFGAVLVEAMGFSKPIVATKIAGSGVSWVNQDSLTGFNVEVKSPMALSSALKQIAQPTLLTKFGNNAKQRFLTVFSKEAIIESLKNYYLEVLAK
jgi:glycosyltransferase involved in cell wall biosynthesis